LGNVLSEYESNGEFPGIEGDIPGGKGKIKLLSLASSPIGTKLFGNTFRETIDLNYCRGGDFTRDAFCNSVALTHPKVAPGGAYLGQYKDSALEGHYTFTFHARGATANDGEFERTWRTSLFVRPKADGANTKVIVRDINHLSNGGIVASLWVRPLDHLGNYIGPGYDDALEMVSNGFSPFLFTADNLDGSYIFDVQTGPQDSLVVLRALGDDVKIIDLSSAVPGSTL
jgi:hypothetical protein